MLARLVVLSAGRGFTMIHGGYFAITPNLKNFVKDHPMIIHITLNIKPE